MRVEDFGFTPVVGEGYVVTFTNEGNLLSTSEYNGSPLPAVNFPDNSQITFTVTHKETGKVMMHSDFISYNGKLYKTTFQLPLKNDGTNKNANIFIKDLHYDLTTGSVLVQVQGFEGEEYQLSVSDSEMSSQAMSMNITLEDDMHYSIPTTLVQGAKFEVHLLDAHGKSVDVQEFTAPISTDWRHTDTTNDEVALDNPEEMTPTDGTEIPLDAQTQTPEELTGMTETPVLEDSSMSTKDMILFGSGGIIVLLIIVLIIRMLKKRKAEKRYAENDQYVDEEGDEVRDEDDEFDEVDEDEIEPATTAKANADDDEFVEADPFAAENNKTPPKK